MYKLLSILLLTCYVAKAQQIILFAEKPTVIIGDRVSVLTDSEDSVDIDNLINNRGLYSFKANNTQVINFGLTDESIWIKFELYSTATAQWYLEIANPMLEEIEVHQVQNSSILEYRKIGFLIPFSQRVIKYRNPIVPFFLSEGESRTFYIKVKSSTPLSVPLRIGSDKAIINSIHQSDILYTFGFGAILMMLIYNFLIYLATKNQSYLLYCFFLVSSVLLNGHYLGVNFEILWPNFPIINYYGNIWFPALVAFTILPFSIEFLQLKLYFPRAAQWLNYLLIIPIVGILFSFFDEMYLSIITSRAGSIIFISILSVYALLVYRKGFFPARAYMVAFFTFLFFIIIFIFRYNDDYFYNQLGAASLQIGSIAQMALLSIALSDRINLYKKQNEAAKKEKELFIIEQNRLLESEVLKRTALFEEANKDLMKSQQVLMENATLLSKSNKFLEETQKKLIEKDQRLIEAQRLARLASYQIDHSTGEYHFSETIYDTLGLDSSIELNDKTLEQIVYPEDAQNLKEQRNQALLNKLDYTAIYRIKVPNKDLQWIQEVAHPIYDEKGNLSKTNITLQNITKRKINEEKISETYRLLKIQNDNITDSIRYAKRIQSAILPDEAELVNSFGEGFVLYMPKDIVSGDFYWFKRYNQQDSKIILVAADCTGHGVPGALMSIVSHNLLREAIELRKIHQPAQILEDLRQGIRTTLKQGENENRDGLDAAVCLLDIENRTLTFSGSYTPMYYFLPENPQIQMIKPNKLSIGGSQITLNRAFEQVSVPLVDKMTIYLFSDGYQDQFGEDSRKKFMAHRFRALLSEIHTKPLSTQKQILETRIKKWMGNQKQIDDIMVIGVKINFNILDYINPKS